MYNDNERNNYEYHYSCQPGDSDPILPPEPVPVQEPEARRSRYSVGKRIVAGVLCAAVLIGGSFGAGWFLKDRGQDKGETELLVSQRPLAEVKTVSVNGNDKLTYPEIYSANVNSCVSINVTATAGYNFFGQPVKTASSGSGFVITADGYIVTNYHVISGGSSVEVTFNDGSTYPAQIVGGDEDYDIAVIKIDPGENQLQPVVIGSSDSLLVGEDVIAIGNPLGELTFSMSEGIISCLNREINVDGTPFNMIQITAAVNSGNSGGPLFNTYGEVVGIVSAKYSSSSSGASVEGLGFAIPIDDVLDMIKDIMENGQVTTHAYMGVSVADVSYYPQAGVKYGAYLAEVVEDGPAAQAGLQAGDVITMLGTTTITSRDDLLSAVGSKSYQAGDTATVTYVRAGQVYSTQLTFGSTVDMPQQTQAEPSSQQDASGYEDYSPYGDMDEFFEQFFGSGSHGAA